jgi:hypothetical protein
MLKETPKNEGTKNQLTGRGTIGGSSEEPPIVPPTLASIGITKKQSSRAQKLADIDAIIQERKDAANMAERATPLTDHGEIGKGRNRDSITISKHKADSEYLTARIARDNPEILERMKAGVLNPVVSHSLLYSRVYHLPLSSVLRSER